MATTLPLRDHTFLGMTQSLCPECLAVVPATILVRDNRVYFRKTCPTHGIREDFICSDASQYDRMDFSAPTRCLTTETWLEWPPRPTLLREQSPKAVLDDEEATL